MSNRAAINKLCKAAVRDAVACQKAFLEWDRRKDPEGFTLPSLICKNGGSPNAILRIKQAILDSKIALDSMTPASRNIH